ncbi:Pentatricopeptide repeat [Heracleum sosnowskyi]|uniref:Pentatricopeptide repeat n=1 Tax=Heracleum sosnowskyi TaxID=360622 RepID=A0AAD8IJS8_9APIA|nr:Pentatricopeptide repeat [Heracleum sosnowskyi]
MGDDIFGDLERNVNCVEGVKSEVNYKHVSEIVEVIRSGGSDLGLLLDSRSLNLSGRLVVEIFRVLNYDRVPALHFFKWLQVRYPKLCYSSHVCSLMICNCGWLEDYETMIVMLKGFRVKRVCLDDKAFEFLPVLTSSQASIKDTIRRVLDALVEVGGSCCGSGICSLIKMLCSKDSFELAEFVIEITGKNVSHYNIIVGEKCRKCLVGEVHGLLEEMRGFGCIPNISTYNYLLSNLCTTGRMSEACRLVKLMQESGTTPDALSFDILIQYSCKTGKLDIAHQFYNQIVHRGIKPRIQTHVAFVKSYFSAGNCDEALKYVHDLDDQHLQSSNMLYSLVAYLHLKKGHLIVAQSILNQMMDKGLKPNFLVFIKVVKRLQKSCKGSLARDLRSRFSRFTV